jgi:parvulin-like peptidyl-prolyl isomerase
MSLAVYRHALVASAWISSLALAARAADDAQPANPEPRVAATINGEPLYVGEVEGELPAIAQQHRVKPAQMDFARAGLLRQLISRRLVEGALVRDGYASEADIDKELKNLQSRLKEKSTTIEKMAAARGVGLAAARHEVAWSLAWSRYLERNLADGLEGYFKEHHQDLDGTQIRASHILLREERANEPQDQIMARAEKIRQEIESGKMTFEQAAEKYSTGPSRRQGGDLGFFPRNGVMAEEFSKTAFALGKGEISKPVATTYGTHLIRVTEIKPGSVQWTEVIPKIKDRAAADLFQKIADKELETAVIEFTGNAPYFKPGTDDLVLPAKSAAKNGAAPAASSGK